MRSMTLVKLVLIALLASTYVFGDDDPDPGGDYGNKPSCKSGDGKQKCDDCSICQATQTTCKCLVSEM